MCASLMSPETATTEALTEAVERKLKKFNGFLNMPAETRKLVAAGMEELNRRGDENRIR
jgi:hypothetical protein